MDEAIHIIPIKQDLYTGLFWTASFISIFISVIVLYRSRLRSQALVLLAFVQFIMGALLFDLYLARSGWMKSVLWYNDITEWMVISIGPGLFLLSQILVKKRPLLRSEILIHFSVPFFYMLYQLFYILQPIEVKYNAYVNAFHPTLPLVPYEMNLPYDPLCLKEHFEKIILVSIVGYAIAGAVLLYRNVSILRFSEITKSFSKYSFIVWSMGSLLINGILLFFLFLLMEENESHIYIGLALSIEIFILSALFMMTSRVLSSTWIADKYDSSSLASSSMKTILAQVDSFLTDQSYFLNHRVGIKDISKELDIPANHISQTINALRGHNFNDYINSYRVQSAIELIRTGASEQLTMEGIGKQVGFTSKSAFYSAFKKVTGRTPAQFKKNGPT